MTLLTQRRECWYKYCTAIQLDLDHLQGCSILPVQWRCGRDSSCSSQWGQWKLNETNLQKVHGPKCWHDPIVQLLDQSNFPFICFRHRTRIIRLSCGISFPDDDILDLDLAYFLGITMKSHIEPGFVCRTAWTPWFCERAEKSYLQTMLVWHSINRRIYQRFYPSTPFSPRSNIPYSEHSRRTSSWMLIKLSMLRRSKLLPWSSIVLCHSRIQLAKYEEASTFASHIGSEAIRHILE